MSEDMKEKLKQQVAEEHFFDTDEEDEDTQANKYLSFHLATESYGVSIRYIIEIIEIQQITEVPNMPDFVKGVINLRGKVIPVVDLRLRFHLPEREYDDRTCIIVTEINETTIGFIVDTVEEVVEIPLENIEPAPNFKSSSVKERYISGLGKIDHQVKILLDLNKILYEKDLEVLSQP